MSINRRKVCHSLLESPIQDASNGGCFMTLALVDAELFTFFCLEFFANNSTSTDARATKQLPFDASCYDDSNKLCFIILRSIDDETPCFFAC